GGTERPTASRERGERPGRASTYDVRVTERISMFALAAVTALALFVAPWAALSRETGARSAVVLLPDRIVDFTGRTDPVDLPKQGTVLLLTAMGLAAIGAGSGFGGRARRVLWLAGGVTLIATTVWGLNHYGHRSEEHT